jgi:hypothetical protein
MGERLLRARHLVKVHQKLRLRGVNFFFFGGQNVAVLRV